MKTFRVIISDLRFLAVREPTLSMLPQETQYLHLIILPNNIRPDDTNREVIMLLVDDDTRVVEECLRMHLISH
jgi:hypothetical protein